MVKYAVMNKLSAGVSGEVLQENAADGLSVSSFAGLNYMRALESGGWCVAFLNHGDRFASPTYMERHLDSDEVFVLLSGAATLLIGDERREVGMAPGKIYTVSKGTWHQIVTSPGTRCLVVENAETGAANSERIPI